MATKIKKIDTPEFHKLEEDVKRKATIREYLRDREMYREEILNIATRLMCSDDEWSAKIAITAAVELFDMAQEKALEKYPKKGYEK